MYVIGVAIFIKTQETKKNGTKKTFKIKEKNGWFFGIPPSITINVATHRSSPSDRPYAVCTKSCSWLLSFSKHWMRPHISFSQSLVACEFIQMFCTCYFFQTKKHSVACKIYLKCRWTIHSFESVYYFSHLLLNHLT